MSKDRQWLELGLEGLEVSQAERIRAFRLLVLSGALLRQRLDRDLAPSGVTTQQGAMLQWIEAQPEPPTLSAVAAGLGMTHQNVRQIVSALERKGFVEIVVDQNDRRARRLMLTAHHRRFWKRRNPHDLPNVAAWTEAWNDDDVHQAVALLRRLVRSLRAAPDSSESMSEPA